MDLNWFQTTPIPADAIPGTYNYALVTLSYIIAVLASYVALDLAGRVRAETHPRIQYYWLLGGAFAMGAGIWSMHFIGMLAFIMPMPMGYEPGWTIASLFAAILASALALYILKNKNRPIFYMIIGGIFIGLGIATMHYMGMTGMTAHVNIRYLPGLFFLSIGIAILASEAALWLALQSTTGSLRRQLNLKIISALVMGAAICGMHYTGMAAAIFTPLPMTAMTHAATINPYILAALVAIVTLLIIGLALTVSIYSRMMMTAVQNEQEFLNVMLNNLDDGILACDQKGRITVCNKTLSQYCRLRKNMSYYDLEHYFRLSLPNINIPVPLEDNPLYKALQGEHIVGKEYSLIGSNLEKRDVIIDGQPIINMEGEKIGAVIAVHDITNLKQTEKLKKEFVSIVSHELRTPLTSIRGSLSLLLDESAIKTPEEMEKFLQIANNNTDRLIRLINDILDVEKIEAGKMDFSLEDIDIMQVIRDSVTEVTPLADKGQVKINVEPSRSEIVHGDHDRLMQVMVNLLSNAIRFSSPGQSISIIVTPFNATTRVSIIDQGPGIPKEFQKRIFQKFSQADSSSSREKGGSGLGLSICKAIIEKHGGTIEFESSNRGTVFYFDLPKTLVGIEKSKQPHLIKTTTAVLICDSNPDSAGMLKNMLQQRNYGADIALTVDEARDLLSKNNYKVIAMDLVLQDYDGVKFIRELRHQAKTATIPIIIMSTQISEKKKALNGMGFPLIDWLQKPVDEDHLVKLIDYIKSQYQDQLPRILCVEDDPDISQLISRLLKNKATVYSATTFNEARDLLDKEPFELIVLDLKLPDGIGTNLLPSINIETKEVIPVVVFSAYELDPKYTHLVKTALLKSKVSNQQLVDVLQSVLKKDTKELVE